MSRLVGVCIPFSRKQKLLSGQSIFLNKHFQLQNSVILIIFCPAWAYDPAKVDVITSALLDLSVQLQHDLPHKTGDLH